MLFDVKDKDTKRCLVCCYSYFWLFCLFFLDFCDLLVVRVEFPAVRRPTPLHIHPCSLRCAVHIQSSLVVLISFCVLRRARSRGRQHLVPIAFLLSHLAVEFCVWHHLLPLLPTTFDDISTFVKRNDSPGHKLVVNSIDYYQASSSFSNWILFFRNGIPLLSTIRPDQ